MKKPRLPHLSIPTWLALAALLVALAAPPAAFALGKASVGTWHLKKGAVTSAKVKDGTLRRRDMRPGARPRPPRAFTFRTPRYMRVPDNDQVARLDLPAGRWLVHAGGTSFDGNGGGVICNLVASGQTRGSTLSQSPGLFADAWSMTSVVRLSSARAVAVICDSNSGGQVGNRSLTATRAR